MNATMVTTQPPLALPVSGALYRQICATAKELRIPPEALHQCGTLDAVHTLARQAYHALARRYHPDAYAAMMTAGTAPSKPTTGATFRRLTASYAWLIRLDATLVFAPPSYELPLAPVPDAVVPSALERRPSRVPAGWQEVPHGW